MKHQKTRKKPARHLKRSPRKTRAGAMLRAAREKRGLALLDVQAVTGLLGGGISHLENGRSIPSLMTALILCNFYGLSLKKLAEAVAADERVAMTTKSKAATLKPKRRVGANRRMRLKRQVTYKRRINAQRRKAHDELAAYFRQKHGT